MWPQARPLEVDERVRVRWHHAKHPKKACRTLLCAERGPACCPLFAGKVTSVEQMLDRHGKVVYEVVVQYDPEPNGRVHKLQHKSDEMIFKREGEVIEGEEEEDDDDSEDDEDEEMADGEMSAVQAGQPLAAPPAVAAPPALAASSAPAAASAAAVAPLPAASIEARSGGKFTPEEDDEILRLKGLGYGWSKMQRESPLLRLRSQDTLRSRYKTLAKKQPQAQAEDQPAPPPPPAVADQLPNLPDTMARVATLFGLPTELVYLDLLKRAELMAFGSEQGGRQLERALRLLEA